MCDCERYHARMARRAKLTQAEAFSIVDAPLWGYVREANERTTANRLDKCERGVLSEFRAPRAHASCASYWFEFDKW